MLRLLTGWVRQIYEWVIGWAKSPYSTWALFVIAFVESSFFPIPPDVLLITLAVAIPARAFRYASVCTLGSILGGALGYLIGHQFYDILGAPIITLYAAHSHYEELQGLYQRYDAFAVAVAGITPIPYKIATITAGFFDIDFSRFMLASIVSRSARFFLIGLLIRLFGPLIRSFIEKYFELLTIVLFLLLIAGFVILEWLL